MPKELTVRQTSILNTVCDYIDKKGYPPSVRDIGEIQNLASPSTVLNHLNQLKKKGYITWLPGQPRTLRVLKANKNCLDED